MFDTFCSKCGARLVAEATGRLPYPVCPNCGRIAFPLHELGVGGLLVHDERVLLMQRKSPPNIGSWMLPSGYVEPGEPPHLAVIREIKEETGLKVQVTGLVGVWYFPTPEKPGIWMVFGLELSGPQGDLLVNGEGVEVEHAAFFSHEELASLPGLRPISLWLGQTFTPADGVLKVAALPEALLSSFRYANTTGYLPSPGVIKI